MTANTDRLERATLKVTTETRDRINALLADEFKGMTVDQLISYFIDENWKAKAIEDWDRFREHDPEGWQAYLQDADNAAHEEDWSAISGKRASE